MGRDYHTLIPVISGPGKVPPARTVLEGMKLVEDSNKGIDVVRSLSRVAIGGDDLVDYVEVGNRADGSINARYE